MPHPVTAAPAASGAVPASHTPDQPEVPLIIVDQDHKNTYQRGRFMGRGGFARCYEVIDQATNATYACKIVAKCILQKQHHREKMTQEVAIHRSLKHPYVVQFHAYFEDRQFIYIILELCSNRSLMEMQKRRKQLTEPEARYFVRHIIDACQYLHSRHIVHRDLKLGNLFLSDEMEIKLGDFGLAAKMESDESRRNTLCGTPNYIAPEILERKGHGYEVDVWSLGCILYTLLVGRPPFETSNLKSTYEKIKNCDYNIPSRTSKPATDFIRACLNSKPQDRPTMPQLLQLEFFRQEYFTPRALPTSCLTMQPRFTERQVPSTYSQAQGSTGAQKAINVAIELKQPHIHQQQQAYAVNNQPARTNTAQPLQHHQYPASSQHQPLPVPNKHTIKTAASAPSVTKASAGAAVARPLNSNEPNARHKQQMQPAAACSLLPQPDSAPRFGDGSCDPSSIKRAESVVSNAASSINSSKTPAPPAGAGITPMQQHHQPSAEPDTNSVPSDYWLSALCDTIQRVYHGTSAVAEAQEAVCYDAAEDPSLAPMVWVSKWVDYSDKYGLGYQLNDNSVGVLFNDATKLLLLEEGDQMQYVDRTSNESYINLNQVDQFSSDVKKKVTLLRYFHNYMRENLLRAGEDLLPTKETNRMARLPWMRTWFRAKTAINMHLTNGTLQINFFNNHEKIILCPLMLAVTVIDSEAKEMHTYSLEKFLEMKTMPAALRDQLEYATNICSKLLNHRVSGSCRLRLPDSESMMSQQDQQSSDIKRPNSTRFQRHISAEQPPMGFCVEGTQFSAQYSQASKAENNHNVMDMGE